MSMPRAVIPSSFADMYQTHSISKLAKMNQSSNHTIRRWLVEHGVVLRPQGVRLKPSK